MDRSAIQNDQTPRTELFERARRGAPKEYEWAANDYQEALAFARHLERELAQANARIEQLEDELDDQARWYERNT